MLKTFKLEKKIDKRGFLIQNDYEYLSKNFKHFFFSSTKPKEIRGNHYHKKKREWFYVIQGKMELHLLNLKTQEKSVHLIDEDNCELIEMEPNIVHAFKNIGKNNLLFFAIVNEKFESNRPDTIFYKIL